MTSSSTKGNIRHGKLKSQKELKKIAEPFIKSAREVANAEEAVGLSEAKQLFKGLKAGVKKVTKKRK